MSVRFFASPCTTLIDKHRLIIHISRLADQLYTDLKLIISG